MLSGSAATSGGVHWANAVFCSYHIPSRMYVFNAPLLLPRLREAWSKRNFEGILQWRCQCGGVKWLSLVESGCVLRETPTQLRKHARN